MKVYHGKSVFGGIAIGKTAVYQKSEQQVKRVKVEDPDQEMARYGKAKAEGIRQLQGLYDKALKEVGEANAAIFEMQQKILEEEEFVDRVVNIVVEEKLNAEYQALAEQVRALKNSAR